MAKMTVADLAKKVNKPEKEVFKKLEGMGFFGADSNTELRPDQLPELIFQLTGKKVKIVKKPAEGEAPAAETKPAKTEKPAKAEDKPAKTEKPAEEKPVEKTEEKPVEAKLEKKPEETEPKKEEKKPVEAKTEKPAETKTEKPAEDKPAKKPETAPKTDARPARPTDGRDNRQGEGRQGGYQNRDNRQGDGRQGGYQGGSRQGDGNRQGGYQGGSRQGDGNRQGGYQGGSRQGDGNRQGRGNQGGAPDKDKDAAQTRPAGNRSGQTRRPSGGDAVAPVRKDDKTKKAEDRNRSNEKDKKRANNANNRNDDFNRKRQNNTNFQNQMGEDEGLEHHKKKPTKKPQPQAAKVVEEEITMVTLPETMTVKEFAEALHRPMPQIIKELMGKGIMASMNQTIEFAQAEEIALDMGILVEHQAEEDIFATYAEQAKANGSDELLQERPPVVVVMGHVDHGKTSLLDAIRNSHVTEGEAGGITQHIGASVVEINGRKITFLDTPGHEAFTAMRLRGAMVTDIAILVVAADDGVMPQTVEAINHAKAAGVQIIVAINKMDKPGANADRIKQELTEYGLVAEDWGGTTICVPVSAKKRENIDTLLEMVLLVADMGELKANPDCPAVGTIIESELDKGRGAVATVLVQQGTLHVGDVIVSGSTFGRVKAMVDDKGRRVKEAGPSKPVEIIGLSDVPAAGEPMYVTPTEKEARALAEKVSAKDRAKMIEGNKKVSLTNLFGDIQAGNVKDLNIIVKADVQGSVEAVKQSLEKLSNEEVNVRVIHGAVGAINESDVMLASASNSVIIGFNVRPDSLAKSKAEEEKVDVRLYRVIYNAIEDIEAAMKGMLDPKFEEKLLGHAEVRQVYKVSSVGTIAGSYVTDGKITRSAKARLLRDNIVIYEGEMDSLRRFKDDVREVASGYECGIMLNKFSDIKEGDVIEAFIMEEVAR